MATWSLDDLEDYIRDKVEQDHLTHSEISERLEARFPGVRGFSIRSVGRFCQEKGIHKTSRLSQAEVEQVVAEGVAKVFILRCLYSTGNNFKFQRLYTAITTLSSNNIDQSIEC